MSENRIIGRAVQKHDVEANWQKAANFIPMQGEIIVYDVDATHDHERVKIGDGETTVSNLPFVADTITEDEINEICGTVYYTGEEVSL